MTIAERIKTLRHDRQWSVDKLCRHTATLIPLTIRKIEGGQTVAPTPATLQQLATAFDMTLSEFFEPVVIDIED